MNPAVLSRRQVVLLPFPFSDLSSSKLRPALVLAEPYADPLAAMLIDADFVEGGLRLTSYARPAKLFTANASLVRSVAGRLADAAHGRVCDALVRLLRGDTGA